MLKIIWADNFMTGEEKKKKGTGSGCLVQTGHQSTVAKDVCFRSLGIYILGFPGGSGVKTLPAK